MYGGLIMEDGTVEETLPPKHPYTMGLIDSIPVSRAGRSSGLSPFGTRSLIHPPKGCPFSTRCPYCMNVWRRCPYFRGWPPDDVLAPPREAPSIRVCSAEGGDAACRRISSWSWRA
ncbi:MAG: oligopeptide/dipeptide ABC transporter ATP-binding protein [Dysosmobacter welbionis]